MARATTQTRVAVTQGQGGGFYVPAPPAGRRQAELRTQGFSLETAMDHLRMQIPEGERESSESQARAFIERVVPVVNGRASTLRGMYTAEYGASASGTGCICVCGKCHWSYCLHKWRTASDATLGLPPPARSCDRMLGVRAHAPHETSRTSAQGPCGRHRRPLFRPRSTHTPVMPSEATGGWPCLHPPCVSSRAHHRAHYRGKGIHGTPREERGSRRQKEEEPQSVSRRVAGNLSSTRAELAAIAQTVKIAPIETDLIILIDSAAAIRRLTWFRRKELGPHPRRTKDYDIVQEIVLSLKDYDIVQEIVLSLDERGRHGARTTMVKVHGHTGEPLHAGERMQWQRREPTGKWKPMSDRCTRYQNSPT
jgi:hypothetical protein